MGHPYNQAQQIVLQNLSAQRFVGTDIQKNILYGRDLPVLRFDYTGLQKGIYHDGATFRYELITSGTYIPTILDGWNVSATGFYFSRGIPLDRSTWSVVHSGIEQAIPFDYPVLGYITSGLCDPAFRQVTYNMHRYTGVDVVSIPYDRPFMRGTVPSAGTMLGIISELPERAGFFFETGVMFAGDHIAVEQSFETNTEEGYTTQFFFQTGRLDGPGS
jgi:hypothetical protein